MREVRPREVAPDLQSGPVEGSRGACAHGGACAHEGHMVMGVYGSLLMSIWRSCDGAGFMAESRQEGRIPFPPLTTTGRDI